MSGALATVPPRHVVVAESEPGCVLAAVSLARRLPRGADLVFVRRDDVGLLSRMPAHRNRPRDYRLLVVGLDRLSVGDAQALRADPAVRIDWLDANEWTEDGASEVRELCRGGGAWFHAPRTHHPFPALEAAAGPLELAEDPFSATLLALAEERLPAEEEAAFGRVWRDALAALAARPLELISGVKPLVHGMPLEIGDYEATEAAGLRGEIDGLTGGSTILRVPVAGAAGVLLVSPAPGRIHEPSLAAAALARTGADVALSLFDSGNVALLFGRHRGGDPPVDVRPAVQRAMVLGWVRLDRLQAGSATLRFQDPPRDAARALVAALGA